MNESDALWVTYIFPEKSLDLVHVMERPKPRLLLAPLTYKNLSKEQNYRATLEIEPESLKKCFNKLQPLKTSQTINKAEYHLKTKYQEVYNRIITFIKALWQENREV